MNSLKFFCFLAMKELYKLLQIMGVWGGGVRVGRSSRSGEILLIFNYFGYNSKDFFHIMHHEGEQYVDQEYVNICSKKSSCSNHFCSGYFGPKIHILKTLNPLKQFFKNFQWWKWLKVHEKNINSFSKKIIIQGKWAILSPIKTYHHNYI